ncbi:rhodopsin isoform X2 [Cephus cinctus]|uniref:Rhodopsin isoform X2 n=1 Tax=Cephus cinctus TaxID=211228 RepID=A0AAJ7W7Y9_CEPCN|nr:rhodopsin isoform X2 [Cephus cinctus]
MLLTLRVDQKKHLLFLAEQTPQVLQDFCKLALDYLQKGPNFKHYSAAGQKLEVEPDVIKNTVEALVNLIIESCKYKLSDEDFRDSIVALGFTDEKETLLKKLYEVKKLEVSDALTNIGIKLPQYQNMEWRFDVQIASRSLLSQVTPLITLDFMLKNTETPDEIEHVLLQTDPTNLLHLAHELEMAMQEGRSQHIRRIDMEMAKELISKNFNNSHTVSNEYSTTVTVATIISETLITIGPQAARQWMRYNNQTVVDKVPPEMIHLIDSHWYQYPPMDPLWHKILGLVMIVIGILGWCGNGVVVYVFLMTPSLRTPSNLLVVNLAFSDFLMMIIMSPPMVVNCYYETWVLGPLMCDIYAMVGSLCGGASIWTMTAISLDRYNVIVKGMSGTPLTIKRALLQILLIWSFALVWTILPMVGWNRYVPEGNMTSCGTDYLNKSWVSRSYILVYSIFVYYTPLFTIIYSYYFIVSTVAAHERGMREQAKKMNVASLRSGDNQAASAEAKLAKVALTTISLWFMAWTPYLVINYMGIFNGQISPLFTIWGSLFAKTNATYNPIVYGISHPKYRAALKEKIPFLVCGSTNESAAASTTAAAANADTASTGTADGKA